MLADPSLVDMEPFPDRPDAEILPGSMATFIARLKKRPTAKRLRRFHALREYFETRHWYDYERFSDYRLNHQFFDRLKQETEATIVKQEEVAPDNDGEPKHPPSAYSG